MTEKKITFKKVATYILGQDDKQNTSYTPVHTRHNTPHNIPPLNTTTATITSNKQFTDTKNTLQTSNNLPLINTPDTLSDYKQSTTISQHTQSNISEYTIEDYTNTYIKKVSIFDIEDFRNSLYYIPKEDMLQIKRFIVQGIKNRIRNRELHRLESVEKKISNKKTPRKHTIKQPPKIYDR